MATLSASGTEDQQKKADIEESLEKSYLLMKTKLDELEQYNKALESHLGSIFSSISQTMDNVRSKPDDLGESSVRGETELSEEEQQTNWKSVKQILRSDEDVESCQVLAQSQLHTEPILHINENCEETSNRKHPGGQLRTDGDLSEIIRELRLSDIGDLKRALLLKKTQRSFSGLSRGAGEEDRPYLDRPRATRNENVPIKFQEDHISPGRADLNNNNSKSNESEHSQFKSSVILERRRSGGRLAVLPPPHPASDKTTSVNLNGNQRFVNSKRYFTPTKAIKTERSRSTGDNPLHFQFYPDHSSNKYQEVWSLRQQRPEAANNRLLTLENIIENDDHHYGGAGGHREGLRDRRFLPLESPSYRTLADIKTCRSKKYSSKTQSIDGFSQVGRKNSFMKAQSDRSSQPDFHVVTSSSSLSPPSVSSSSSISASTVDYPTTEEESLDKDNDDANLLDEFFLFPYEVLDQNFDDICLELSRFSADIESMRQRGQLKAAKASDEWNTLWIYRGV